MSFTTVKTHNVHKLGGISQVSVATWLGHEEQIFNDHVIANLLVPKLPPPSILLQLWQKFTAYFFESLCVHTSIRLPVIAVIFSRWQQLFVRLRRCLRPKGRRQRAVTGSNGVAGERQWTSVCWEADSRSCRRQTDRRTRNNSWAVTTSVLQGHRRLVTGQLAGWPPASSDRSCRQDSCKHVRFVRQPQTATSCTLPTSPYASHLFQRWILTLPAQFFHYKCGFCHEETDPVRQACLLRLRAKYLEPVHLTSGRCFHVDYAR